MLSKKLMVLLGAVLAMVLGSAVPAVAQDAATPAQNAATPAQNAATPAQNASTPAKTTVFVPAQTAGNYRVPDPGGTLSCSGTPYSAPSGTCTPAGNGMVANGQVCDTPTTVTVYGSTQLSAFECHAPTSPTLPTSPT
jgi:hypothetical protein